MRFNSHDTQERDAFRNSESKDVPGGKTADLLSRRSQTFASGLRTGQLRSRFSKRLSAF
jgi:hypothetical protein